MIWLNRLFLALAIGCAVAAGYFYVAHEPGGPPPPFVLDSTEFTFTDITPGKHDLVVNITNPAKIPRRIIGLAEG